MHLHVWPCFIFKTGVVIISSTCNVCLGIVMCKFSFINSKIRLIMW